VISSQKTALFIKKAQLSAIFLKTFILIITTVLIYPLNQAQFLKSFNHMYLLQMAKKVSFVDKILSQNYTTVKKKKKKIFFRKIKKEDPSYNNK
jgi:hypothetical protein